jgi:hypothetical protein
MENRLFSRDHSLNVRLSNETDIEWQDMIMDEEDTQDIIMSCHSISVSLLSRTLRE